ncbi:MAG: serine hydrolase [Bacteroidota bacterium]|nr:serine hydrolase [Bacteroidota bacterium]|tara:strand:+ start:1849 stop:2730 length:882 start_codon:yes stop_codon:yes gene_type:complete
MLQRSILILIGLSLGSCDKKIDYNILEKKIISKFNDETGNFALAFKNLDDGKEILINENEIFHAASTMKTPVMIEFYKQLHQGKLSLEDTLQIKNEFKSIVDGTMYKLSEFDDSDKNTYNKLGQYYSINNLIYEMITISSNFATNILIDYIGANNVTKSMKEIGALNIDILRGVEDIKAFELGLNNTTSAKDLLIIYEKLAKGKIINNESSAIMIDILKDQKYDDIIPKYLPKDIEIANKTGMITGVHHDSGIVFLKDGKKYVIIILSKNMSDMESGTEMMAKISELIYKTLN